MKHRALLTLIFTSLFLQSHAQKEHAVWYFGFGAGVNFLNDSAEAIQGGAINSREGCASICEKESGILLFYTDGSKIWNREHSVMQNGDDLEGDYSSAQSAVIIPNPANEKQYYVFTTATAKGLNYSMVDMSLDKGLGAVLKNVKNKQILKSSQSSEKLCAVKHANGTDFWIITHAVNGNEFFVFEVTAQGVSKGRPFAIGSHFKLGGWNEAAQLKVSVDGKKLVNAIGPSVSGTNSNIEIMGFNNASGEISGPVSKLKDLGFPYGVEFSPNGDLLYVAELSGKRVLQFDLREDEPEESLHVLCESENLNFGSLQLGPDGRIYVSGEKGYNEGYSFLSVIVNPDSAGDACNFRRNHVKLKPGKCLIGLPSMYAPDYLNKKQEQKEVIVKEKEDEVRKSLIEETAKVGDIILVPIYYRIDSVGFTKETYKILDSMVTSLKSYPNIKIEIASHTDCRNTAEYNQSLSQRRADAVQAYLVSQGIDKSRMTAKGYGESQLKIQKCTCEGPNSHEQGKLCTEAEHQLNRRTEIRITAR